MNKSYKLITKGKKGAQKIVWLAKAKLITIEVLISKALMDSKINHDEFFLINMMKWKTKLKV